MGEGCHGMEALSLRPEPPIGPFPAYRAFLTEGVSIGLFSQLQTDVNSSYTKDKFRNHDFLGAHIKSSQFSPRSFGRAPSTQAYNRQYVILHAVQLAEILPCLQGTLIWGCESILSPTLAKPLRICVLVPPLFWYPVYTPAICTVLPHHMAHLTRMYSVPQLYVGTPVSVPDGCREPVDASAMRRDSGVCLSCTRGPAYAATVCEHPSVGGSWEVPLFPGLIHLPLRA